MPLRPHASHQEPLATLGHAYTYAENNGLYDGHERLSAQASDVRSRTCRGSIRVAANTERVSRSVPEPVVG
jgi:hypothetical protein